MKNKADELKELEELSEALRFFGINLTPLENLLVEGGEDLASYWGERGGKDND